MDERPEAVAAPRDPAEVIGRRIAAGAIDLVLMFVLFLVLGIALGEGESSDGNLSVTLEDGEFLLFLALMLLYYFATEAGWGGQTVGKRLLGLRVAARDGGTPSTGQVAGRTALRLLDVLPALYLLGFIVMLVTPAKQRIGDLAAGTVVTRTGS